MVEAVLTADCALRAPAGGKGVGLLCCGSGDSLFVKSLLSSSDSVSDPGEAELSDVADLGEGAFPSLNSCSARVPST
jgi:hypothetical protein